jgi:broad specificity phosphatase PhoE
VDLGGIECTKCYTSDVHRAVKTAQQIFSGEIIKLKELREIPMYPLFKRNVKLPFILWAMLIRTAWLINHKSQPETKSDVEKRMNSVLNQILQNQNENILVVGHGAFLMMMSKELLKRGFIGKKITRPENGKLYIFEKN